MTNLEKYDWARLRYLEGLQKNPPHEDMIPAIENAIKDCKETIRSAQRRKETRDRSYGHAEFIKNKYPDYGYWEKIILPERFSSTESAEEFFREEWFCECRPSMYDCTGQRFTENYKITKQGGRYVVYHEVGVDL